MKKIILWIAAIVLVIGASVAAFMVASTDEQEVARCKQNR